MHLKGDNVMLIISERRQMEDNIGGIHPFFLNRNIDASRSGWSASSRASQTRNGQKLSREIFPPFPSWKGVQRYTPRLISLSLVLAPRCRYALYTHYIDIKIVHCRRGQPPRLHSLHTRYVKCNEPFGFSFFILISAGLSLRLESPRSRQRQASERIRSSRRVERSAREKGNLASPR